MPSEAQELYIKKFNESWENYTEKRGGDMGRRGVAHRDAIDAIRKQFVKGRTSDKWYRKGERPESENENDDNFWESLFNLN